jgi:hypothetical protein
MRLTFVAIVVFCQSMALCFAEAQTAHNCLSYAEARRVVSEQKLMDSLAVMKSAVILTKAEPLHSRLCRWNQDMVYEVSLLRRDGHVIRVNMRATDGKIIGPRESKELIR